MIPGIVASAHGGTSAVPVTVTHLAADGAASAGTSFSLTGLTFTEDHHYLVTVTASASEAIFTDSCTFRVVAP